MTRHRPQYALVPWSSLRGSRSFAVGLLTCVLISGCQVSPKLAAAENVTEAPLREGPLMSLPAKPGLPGHDRADANASLANPTMATDLSLWEEAGVELGLPTDEAAHRIANVLRAHHIDPTERNARAILRAMLRLRDTQGVSTSRQLSCLESGSRSPAGNQWQDTLAWCVRQSA